MSDAFRDLCIETYLPPHGALPRELLEDDVLFRVLLLVLLAARLNEECIRGHPPPRLRICCLSSRHFVLL